MKKLLISLSIALVLLFSAADLNAQKMKASSVYDNTVFVNPFGLIFGLIDVSYEMKMSPTNSLMIRGIYWNLSSWWKAYGIGASYRWYLQDLFKDGKTPLEGFSVGPRIDIMKWSYDFDGYTTYDGGTSIAIGGEASYKWVFGTGWTVEPTFNLTFPVNSVNGLTYQNYGLGVGLGYSW